RLVGRPHLDTRDAGPGGAFDRIERFVGRNDGSALCVMPGNDAANLHFPLPDPIAAKPREIALRRHARKWPAVWLNRIFRSSSVGGAERRSSLPRSTPRLTAGRSRTAARQRATLGNSSTAWPSGLAISTQGQEIMSAIE